MNDRSFTLETELNNFFNKWTARTDSPHEFIDDYGKLNTLLDEFLEFHCWVVDRYNGVTEL